MRIDYFKNFIELAHCDNFSDAAKRLHVSQPVLSKHISLLEKEFGVLLFNRHKPNVELTEQGKILLEEAYFIVEHFQRAKTMLAKTSRSERNIIVFGGINRNADVVELISRILYRIQKDKVDITLKRKDFHDRPFLEQVVEGRVDVLFSILNIDEPPLDSSLEAHFLFSNPLFALMRKNHHLATRESLRLSDLSSETIIMPLGCYALVGRQVVEPKLSSLNPPPSVRPVYFESINDFANVVLKDDIMLIESALLTTFRFPESIVAVPISEEDISFPFYAIAKKDNPHKMLPQLIELISSEAQRMTEKSAR